MSSIDQHPKNKYISMEEFKANKEYDEKVDAALPVLLAMQDKEREAIPLLGDEQKELKPNNE